MNNLIVSYPVLKGSTNLMKYYFVTILIQQVTMMLITGKLNRLNLFFFNGDVFFLGLKSLFVGVFFGLYLSCTKERWKFCWVFLLVVVFNPIICDFYIDLLLMSRAYLAI